MQIEVRIFSTSVNFQTTIRIYPFNIKLNKSSCHQPVPSSGTGFISQQTAVVHETEIQQTQFPVNWGKLWSSCHGWEVEATEIVKEETFIFTSNLLYSESTSGRSYKSTTFQIVLLALSPRLMRRKVPFGCQARFILEVLVCCDSAESRSCLKEFFFPSEWKWWNGETSKNGPHHLFNCRPPNKRVTKFRFHYSSSPCLATKVSEKSISGMNYWR